MCGIAGILQANGRPVDPSILRAMSRAIAHRGPDDVGFLGWSPPRKVRIERSVSDLGPHQVGLIHQRLSILDLSESGWQPMASADRRYYISFNGEIYNYLELQAELKQLGFQPKSHSDTEVLLAAYVQWGAAALPKLVGMFAFAIFDSHERTLFLARDSFGIKPLYYSASEQTFAFASEIPALLKHPAISRQVNPQTLYYYLHNGHTDHTSATLFSAIQQVPPGHSLTVSLARPGRPQLKRYWSLQQSPQPLDLSFSEAAEQLRERFLDNIRLHLRSDVPVGTALSGGIDSSAIVSAMRHLEGPSLQIHTFSYVADDPAFSEESWVDQVGLHANTIVHKVRATPQDLIRDLDILIRSQGEPFGSTSIYAQYKVFQLAKVNGIKVMLDGQGADELLGGYRPYLAARLATLLGQGHLRQAVLFAQRASKLSGCSWKYLLTRAMGLLLPEAWAERAKGLVGRQQQLPWLNAEWLAAHNIQPLPGRLSQHPQVLHEQLARALTVTSVPMLLRYEDRNAMIHSVESRVPFLTPDFANFIFSLPESYIIDAHATSKSVFREAMRGIAPDAVLNRTDKIGFATPEQRWLREMQPWFESVLKSDRARSIPALNMPAVHQEFDAIVTGRQPFDFRVWRWVNLIRWSDCFDVVWGE